MDMRQRCVDGLREGVRLGWWQDVDEASLNPVRALNRCDFHETALWAHAWVTVGKFNSIKEAKRAGQDTPLDLGQRRLGTWILRIV